ncbi:DJ-1 protein-PfpI domain-containing protein [Mycena kentingensis (nom. inval.)]|nr:DJ-1 protein-PfpI domain-containing protein [Mycena kentingensis (nom. inval.)]
MAPLTRFSGLTRLDGGIKPSSSFCIPSPTMSETLAIAVCMPDGVTLSDFIPGMEILSMLNTAEHPEKGAELRKAAGGNFPYKFTFDFLAMTREGVAPLLAPMPRIQPTTSYAEAAASGRQWDILFVPAGRNPNFETGAHPFPEEEIAFIAQQAPNARFVMSVCTGANQLALAGVLAGKRATMNKQFFTQIAAVCPNDITWVPKARWVVDGKVWTSSGVIAGADMVLAFVEHLINKEVAQIARAAFEIAEVTQENDPFAAYFGLV